MAYYRPEKGEVQISGVPVTDLQNLSNLVIVRQEPVLFADSLRNNLCFYQDVPDEALIAMLRRLQPAPLCQPRRA